MIDDFSPTCLVCGVPVRDVELHQQFHDGLTEICRKLYAPDSTPEEFARAVAEQAGRHAAKAEESPEGTANP